MSGVWRNRQARCVRQLQRLTLLLCLCGTGASGAESVQSLRYGVALYHLYQQEYFLTLTELGAARELHQLGPHAEAAELLRGGVSLSWGMDREAQQIFQHYLQREHEPAHVDRDQAWFYLAKLAWMRGDSGRAGQTLAQVDSSYTGALAEQAWYLRGALAQRMENDTALDEALAQLPEPSPWRPYLLYNRGAAAAALADFEAAQEHFVPLQQSLATAATPELQALADKVAIAAGYAHLATQEVHGAARDFASVRLHSPLLPRALLGYGWALAGGGDYLAALGPWQQLADGEVMDDSVRQGLLAVPWVWEQLQRPHRALQAYTAAAKSYEQALADVDEAAASIRGGALAILLQLEPEAAADWFGNVDLLPGAEREAWLRPLLARTQVQLAMREVLDLYQLQAYQAQARERLAVLRQVDADQQQVWDALVEDNQQAQLAEQQQVFREQFDALTQRYELARQPGQERLLAPPDQALRWQRLQRAERTHAALPEDVSRGLRLRLLRGLMQWQDSEAAPRYEFQMARELRALEQQLSVGDARLEAVIRAAEGRQQASFGGRIDALEQRLAERRRELNTVLQHARQQLDQVALAELQRQRKLLEVAYGQAQLAQARLYDRAARELPL